MKKASGYGGWYFAECPSMRGDEDAPLGYDPTFHAHSSVARDCYWLDLVETTGGIKVDAYMCMLRTGYPPKPEGSILSPNLGWHIVSGRVVVIPRLPAVTQRSVATPVDM